MASRISLPSEVFQRVFLDTVAHLGSRAPLFLTLLDQLLATSDSCHVDRIIRVAKLLKRLPAAFYQLNSVFHPYARVEFNIRQNPVTGFVLKVANTSRIVLLDSSLENASFFHNLTATRLCDILINCAAGDREYDDLHAVTDPAIRDCLAQLAQDILDNSFSSSRTDRKEVLRFLRRCAGVPPSLLLHELEQLDPFCYTFFSDLHHGMLGAVKVVIKKPRIFGDRLDKEEILGEVILYRQFRHPNVLPFLGVTYDEQCRSYGLVTPYMKHGSIIQFLKHHPSVNRLTPLWQIMKGLQFLHSFKPPVAHRDIKGANILVRDTMICCLSDFGLSSIPELSQRSHEQAVGTAAWMAPEILAPPEHGRLDLLKVDIFALGITILEIYTGKPPLANKNLSVIYNARVVRKEKPSLPPACPHPFPSFLSEIVGMMLEYDPSKRPDIRMICQGIEDILSPPSHIVLEGLDQQYTVESQAPSTDELPSRSFILEMIKKERECVGRLEKRIEPSNDAPDPILLQSTTPYQRSDSPFRQTRSSRAVLLRQATQRATTQHPSRVMSPSTDVDFSRGLPTPVTDVPPSPLPMAIVGSDLPGAFNKRLNPLDHVPSSSIHHPRLPRLTIPLGSTEGLVFPTPFQSDHCELGDRPPRPLSTTSKRSRLSFSTDDTDIQENIPPSPVWRGVGSPKRRRCHDSQSSSPITVSGREFGSSVH
ncbi:kinase-like protein [Macrolepiota fuliginosa MF-IS2]|uniref:Kinase-like protein n=1 Tax=Macrolepiota fuliginosa MF-IS2 TaxID=1400762 RepID=A0A9P5X9T7_9AGAR|nr:kinase-like protein [Macrolepiota fuliginosa MF-IS2]